MSGLTSAAEMLAVLLAGLLLTATPNAVEQARIDFERGAALYRAGSYREALSAFEEAQARSPAPQALFNIARCHDRLGEFVDAVEGYRAYLRRPPRLPTGPRSRLASTSCRAASRSRPRSGWRSSRPPRCRWTTARHSPRRSRCSSLQGTTG